MSRAFYYGCVREAGHYLFDEQLFLHIPSHRWPNFLPWAIGEVDGGLVANASCGAQGEASLHRKDGWTAVAFCDRSIDSRPGSISVFLFEEHLTFAQACARARERFPSVWTRFRFDVYQHQSQRPRCAVCLKPVAEFEELFDVRRGPAGKVRFIARCHGAEETVEVCALEMEHGQRIHFGDAFVTTAPALEAHR